MSLTTIWSVTFTHYDDDYKCRDGDWAATTKPKLFLHRSAAEFFLCNELVDQIHEKIECNPGVIEKLKKEGYICEFDDTEEGYKIRQSRAHRLEALETIAEFVFVGEYVSRTLSWKIAELPVDKSNFYFDCESTEESDSEEKETTEDSNKRSADSATDPAQKIARTGDEN